MTPFGDIHAVTVFNKCGQAVYDRYTKELREVHEGDMLLVGELADDAAQAVVPSDVVHIVAMETGLMEVLS